MGLDMYLNRFPRYKNTTAKQVNAIENYLDLLLAKEQDSKYANCTLKEWCGIDMCDLPNQDVIDFYKEFYTKKFASWDVKQEYGYWVIHEQVGYWRKANSIHNWFVENIQDGIDDCSYHHEVTKYDLEELLDVCTKVYESCTMIISPVKNGQTCTENGWVDNIEMGKVVIDPSVAKELLPTTCGFFFGNTDYNEWYVEDVANTIDIVQRVLETTDFDKEMIYYVSSW